MINAELLTTFVAAYPAQPATAYWRSIEIGAILRYGLPEGFGLDLGCGDGILTDILLAHAGPRKLIGVDLDPLEAEAAEKFPFYERVHVAPAHAIPESDCTFDFVLSNSVLEHILDLGGTIAETARVLRSGGRFLLTVPTSAFHRNLRGPLTPGLSRSSYLEMLDRRLAHYHYLSAADWSILLEQHGMTLDASLGYFDQKETRRWESLSRVTGGLFYAVFRQAGRPREIQRSLGMRGLQNSANLPRPLASALGKFISLGASVDHNRNLWLDKDTSSCLLVAARKK
ncbi:MAG: class I SAM-dependent methyltransferase [Methyloceanibacter sp.]